MSCEGHLIIGAFDPMIISLAEKLTTSPTVYLRFSTKRPRGADSGLRDLRSCERAGLWKARFRWVAPTYVLTQQ